MNQNESMVVEAQMLVRKPVSQVFEAIVNPEITTKFWFTKSSGRLEKGAKLRWDWELFGVGDNLTVLEFEQNQRIVIDWERDPTTAEWIFISRPDGTTLVKICNWGFPSKCDEALAPMIDAKGGYVMVLAGLKAWLEHGVQLELVRDQFPVA